MAQGIAAGATTPITTTTRASTPVFVPNQVLAVSKFGSQASTARPLVLQVDEASPVTRIVVAAVATAAASSASELPITIVLQHEHQQEVSSAQGAELRPGLQPNAY